MSRRSKTRRAAIGVARPLALALPAALAAALALAVGGALRFQAHAQGADLTRATCAQLNRMPSGERRQIALWLHGYYTGAAQRPFLDMGQANAAIAAMLDSCRDDPERPLLSLETGAILRGNAPARQRGEGHIVIEQNSRTGAAPMATPTRPRPLD